MNVVDRDRLVELNVARLHGEAVSVRATKRREGASFISGGVTKPGIFITREAQYGSFVATIPAVDIEARARHFVNQSNSRGGTGIDLERDSKRTWHNSLVHAPFLLSYSCRNTKKDIHSRIPFPPIVTTISVPSGQVNVVAPRLPVIRYKMALQSLFSPASHAAPKRPDPSWRTISLSSPAKFPMLARYSAKSAKILWFHPLRDGTEYVQKSSCLQ